MIRVRHILVVCEDSPDGDEALFAAAGLAQQMGAHLTVVAVSDGKRSDDAARLRRAGVLLTDQPDLGLVTAYGERTTALIETAATYDCDLIVVPASRRRRLLRVADDTRMLRRRSPVPVLQTPSAETHALVRMHSEPLM